MRCKDGIVNYGEKAITLSFNVLHQCLS